MEDDLMEAACSLLESAAGFCIATAAESDVASGSSHGLLPEELLRALNDVFVSGKGFSSRVGRAGSGGCENAGAASSAVDSRLWEEVAQRRIAMGLAVRALANRMEMGGCLGIIAANVYVGLFLIPDCPRYSLFSALVFHSLVRCIRNACKTLGRSAISQEGVQDKRATERGGKKGQKKGKRAREAKQQQDGVDSEVFSCDDRQEANLAATVDEIMLLLDNLQAALIVLPLKEDHGSLKAAIELFVELPHLVSELAEFESGEGAHRTGNRTRAAAQSRVNSPPLSWQSKPSLIFGSLQLLLDPMHGDPLTTAITILKELTPSLLLSRIEGSTQQRAQIRSAALDFVLRGMLEKGCNAMRTAVAALCRYMSFKAPEKNDPRGLAVETVLTVVRAITSREQQQFGGFVVKLSRGKPRHRLFAIDLTLALLTNLPDPLGIESTHPEAAQEQEADKIDCIAEDLVTNEKTNANEAETLMQTWEDEMDIGGERAEKAKISGSKASSAAGKESTASAHSSWWGIACLEALLHRCSDKAPAIRGRALANLAHVLEQLSANVRHRSYLQDLLGLRASSGRSVDPSSSQRPISTGNDCSTPLEDVPDMGGETPSPDVETARISATPLTPGAHYGDLGSLLCKRCLDEKVVVRKAALLLISKSTILMGRPPDEAILQAMGAGCSDAMVSIRKAALSALSEVARRFMKEKRVITEWLQSVLPLVLDNEMSIQDEVFALFEELVLDRISTISTLKLSSLQAGSTPFSASGRPNSAQQQASQEVERLLPPGVLSLLNGIDDGGTVASCVKRICLCLGKKKRLRASVALALQRLITVSESLRGKKRSLAPHATPQGAWLLLAEVSAFVPKAVGWEFLRNHWQLFDRQEKARLLDEHQTPLTHSTAGDQMSAAWAADRVHLLQTISNVAVELPPEAAASLAAEFMEHLETFSMHPAEVGAHVKALTVLCRQKAASSEEGDKVVNTWVKELLDKAEKIIQRYIEMDISDIKIADNHHLQTPRLSSRKRSGAGRSSQPVSSKARKRRAKQSEASGDLVDPCTKIVTAIFTVGALVLVAPTVKTGNLVTLLQTLVTPKEDLRTGQCSHNSDRPSVFENLTPAVHAQTWITLGKLCLADDKLAKRLIPLFVQQLEKASSAAVRNNIMVAMTDLCIRYTFLIDGYIHKITKSLRDSCELVRRQAFVLLARLLQRDYVKWRGMLFHRFLLALVDESAKICLMADFLFGSILRTKAPLLAYNSFVEVIFNLNDCRAHSGFNIAWQRSENERELFSLRGSSPIMAAKRMHIYTSLLKQMAPEHLLATTAKLCAEVVAGAADGLLDLDDASGQCVLEDTLKVLASKEMRIGGSRSTGGADTIELEEESGASAAAAIAAAKGRFVTQLAKKNLVQNAIPIFIELKRLLESKNSPLTGNLMESIRAMLKDYKNEVEEMLVADKQLQKEIMYDMQKHESAKVQSRAQVDPSATAALTPKFATKQKNIAPTGPSTSRHGRIAKKM
ncbi:hypothetical protein O6H91_09G053500 [Diphasiastrum complanatum]|uniref:Uncharacterized protein n=1 Tax=Diphasiastrum complanatum TaxID=34168 RepID=A0ACC2CPE2_DIPCM|nr:hypothetical protein O6H91_09G053500 [Diphasiastrum complanatum]